jgi:hypothetical protein
MNEQDILTTIDLLNSFETRANMVGFMETFGNDKGRKLWEDYKKKCNYNPQRLTRILSEEDKLLFAKRCLQHD